MECWWKVVCVLAVAAGVYSASIRQSSRTVGDNDTSLAVDVYNKGLPGNPPVKTLNTYIKSKQDGEEKKEEEKEKKKEKNDKENEDKDKITNADDSSNVECLCCILNMTGHKCRK
uniref:Phosphatidylinositol transfer protein 3-like n=1 Tax=Geotrypetes seraphini TaxID=260995 RepID=A0A6P8PR95_GEOSA|nr:phosphatidylinositol transfer protein 3-like [Geotrypetes seraphini]